MVVRLLVKVLEKIFCDKQEKLSTFQNGVRIALRRLVKVLQKIFCDKQEKLSTFQK